MNPLTWQNPEQLFVAQVLKKIFYNSVAELRFINNVEDAKDILLRLIELDMETIIDTILE